MSYLPSTAPLPSNSLTPLPANWDVWMNLPAALLSEQVRYAQSITDCYVEATDFVNSVGALAASEVAAAQMTSADAAASASDAGTGWAVPGTGNGNAPEVVPYNSVSLSAPGFPSVKALDVCNGRRRKTQAGQPKMMMPQQAPVIPMGSPLLSAGLSGYAPAWGSPYVSQHRGAMGRLARNPLAVLLVAFGVGYVLTRE